MVTQSKLKLRTSAALLVTLSFFAFQMYIALVRQFAPMLQSPLHLVFALALVFIYYPADCGYRRKVKKAAEAGGHDPDPAVLSRYAWTNWFDALAFAGIAFLLWYVLTENGRLNAFILSVDEVLNVDHAAAPERRACLPTSAPPHP